MQKWEYLEITVGFKGIESVSGPTAVKKGEEALANFLNIVGDEGWEAVGVTAYFVHLIDRGHEQRIYLFKRPKRPKEEYV